MIKRKMRTSILILPLLFTLFLVLFSSNSLNFSVENSLDDENLSVKTSSLNPSTVEIVLSMLQMP